MFNIKTIGPEDNVVHLRNSPEEFPLTLAACQGAEAALWDIGDALLIECPISEPGIKDGSWEKLKKASEYLAANGVKYRFETLRKCRQVAQQFPPDRRLPGVAWNVHYEAGSPETLAEVIAANPGRRVISEMVREFRRSPEFQAARAVKEKKAKAARISKTPLLSSDSRLFNGIARGAELASLFGHSGRTHVSRLINAKGGKEIAPLILAAKDAGFLTGTGRQPRTASLRLLFPDAPMSWAENYMLTSPKDRAYVRDELMPAALANKDAILAEPTRIKEILTEHFTRVGHAKKQVQVEKKREVARAKTEHDDVVVCGKHYWPLWGDKEPDYDFDQLTASYWAFDDMRRGMLAREASTAAISHMIRFGMGRLQKYLGGQGNMFDPIRTKMDRVFWLLLDFVGAMEENPEGKIQPPPLPR